MSKFEVWPVQCPSCGHEQEENVYVSVNASRMSHVTDELIDGTWGRIRCGACAHEYYADSRLLYTHLPEHHWVVQHPWSERESYSTLEDEAERVFQVEYLERPPEPIRAQARGVERRICFGRPQLAEKLLAWRLGIDDRALECFKIVMMRRLVAELFPLGPSEFHLVARDEDLVKFAVVRAEDQRPLRGLEADAADLDRVQAELEDFRAPYPDLFEKAFVNASRYLAYEG